MKTPRVPNEVIKVVVKWIQDNPKQVAFALAGGTVFIAPGVLAGPLLSTLGFTPLGVKAGTFASATQASLGNVLGGSWFAAAQSAGAGGAGAAIFNGMAQAGGAFMAGGAGGLSWIKAKL